MAHIPGQLNLTPVAQAVVRLPVGQAVLDTTAVLLSDGRVLYHWSGGFENAWGYAPDLNTFMTTDNSVVNNGLFQAGYWKNACMTLTWVGTELIMAIAGRPGGSTTWATHILVSPGGLGDNDWVLRGVVQSITSSTNHNGDDRRNISEIYVTPSGRWLLAGGFWIPDYGLRTLYKPCVWSSDDAGVTWTRVYDMPLKTDGYYALGTGRVIAGKDGALWCTSTSDQVNNSDIVGKSTNGGTTWTTVTQTGPREQTWGLTDDTHLYVGRGQGGFQRQLAIDKGSPVEPLFTSPGWVEIRNYGDIGGAGGGPIFQVLGNQIAWMHRGRLLGLGTVPGAAAPQGWVIGYVPLF